MRSLRDNLHRSSWKEKKSCYFAKKSFMKIFSKLSFQWDVLNYFNSWEVFMRIFIEVHEKKRKVAILLKKSLWKFLVSYHFSEMFWNASTVDCFFQVSLKFCDKKNCINTRQNVFVGKVFWLLNHFNVSSSEANEKCFIFHF